MSAQGPDRQEGPERTTGARGAPDRVRRVHAQARTTLRFSLLYLAAGALAAAVGAQRWLVVHLLLVGGVVLAISAVSQMLTVTWSAAPAPSDRVVRAQRVAIVSGAAGLVVAREAELPSFVFALSGTLYAAGLAMLGGLLVVTARRGVERRFDPAVGAYLTAVVAGLVGVGLGLAMAIGTSTPQLRAAHVTVNLLGLVGLVVAGTLPFFAATVGRTRMAPHARPPRMVLTIGWLTASMVLAAAGFALDASTVAAVGLAGYAVGIGGIAWLLPRPTRSQLSWAGPRLIGLWAGAAWWAIAVAATVVDAAVGRGVLEARWLVVLVVTGYAQILWGSLAYLLPVLRGGGHERLSEGFATTRSWPGLVAANVAGACLAVAAYLPAGVAIAVWVIDGAWRALRVGTRRSPRPQHVADPRRDP